MSMVQPLNVLQIRVTFVDASAPTLGSSGDVREANRSTSMPVPLASGGTELVRPTALLEIVTLLLKLTEIPTSAVPVIVLLSIVRLEALNSRIAVEMLMSDPKPEPFTVLPVNVPPAPPTPYWTLFVAMAPAG